MFRFAEIGRKVTALYMKSSIQWGMLQLRVFINKIKMLQRTRVSTIGRRSTRLRMTVRAFPL